MKRKILASVATISFVAIYSFIIVLFLQVVFPVSANAQMYHRSYYEQKSLPKAQTLPYFLENRTGSPLKVTLLVKLPDGGKEWWPFDVEPNSEVTAMLPVGGARVSVQSAVASVPKGNKLVPEEVESYLYDREDNNNQVCRGWMFSRK